ncbi:retrovirus-related pol polyprotein from transposon TNT 1-94 [Tanacetum coccineum]
MSTSKTYQQSLADAGSETRPPMLERGSYIPWASRFRRYINRKRENRKWLNKALDEGPYQFEMFIPNNSTVPKLQTAEDLQGDALLHYDAEMELMNLILLSIPNDIYNSLEKSHDPLALVAHTGSSSRNTSSYYVTYLTSVVDYEDEYQQDDVHTNSEDPLRSVMLLLARAITQKIFTPINNRLRTSSNTRNQAIIQRDRTERFQRTLRTSSSRNTSTVQCYNYSGKGHYAKNCPKPRVRDSKYFMEQMLLAKQDEAGVILTDEQNDFLFTDASRMEEIEELSANICLMASNSTTDNTFDAGSSYDSAFKMRKNTSIGERDVGFGRRKQAKEDAQG